MATLNIKSFPNDLYERLRELAKEEQRSVSQQVIRLLTEAIAEPELRSILELRGLGKEHWQGRDATAFVDEERRSWD